MKISSANRAGILREVLDLLKQDSKSQIITLNSLILLEAWTNKTLANVIRNTDLVVVDSVGISFAVRLFYGKATTRYPGIEMMQDIIKSGVKIYLLGSKPGVAEKAAENLRQKHKNSSIVGVGDGYFGLEDKVIDDINKSGAEVLFVGLNMVRQEIWINKNKEKTCAKIVIGVGGSFDVISGELIRAPKIMQLFGLEWLWRLVLQPWRFSRIISLPEFFLKLLIRFLLSKDIL